MQVANVNAGHPVQPPAVQQARVQEQGPTGSTKPKQDTAAISQKAKDLAAQMSGKTAQEEAKETPVVEMNEEQQGKK